MPGFSCDAIAVTCMVGNAAGTQLLSSGAAPGKYALFLKTASTGVYVGGSTMPIGSEFPAGGITSETGYLGYELTPDQEYQIPIYEDPGNPYALWITTTSSTPVEVSAWAIPRGAPGAS